MTNDTAAELREILKHYDVGELVNWERNDRGYCNISYAIETVVNGEKRRYYLRKYKKGIKERELRFEHSVINHLIWNGFDLVAHILRTRHGRSFVRRQAGEEAIFYAVFAFLSGEDRYTWINPRCCDREVTSCAAVLARFHDTTFGFIPQGKRDELKIVELLPAIAKYVSGCVQRTKNTSFDVYLLENLDLILRNIEDAQRALAEQACQELVQLVVHCDYHPGNLKFEGEKVTGLFDFDWTKVDARCFDVALAILYFFATWEEGKNGAFDLEQVTLFLDTYQRALKDSSGVGPLSEVELEYLPTMIKASNLYVLNWTVVDFYSREVDPNEYLTYLRHGIRTMRWLENRRNWGRLEKICAAVRAQ
jgi:homoserine kinase type II